MLFYLFYAYVSSPYLHNVGISKNTNNVKVYIIDVVGKLDELQKSNIFK